MTSDLNDLNDPWSLASYVTGLAPKQARLMAMRDSQKGAVWLLGNGPSLAALAPAITSSPIPKIGVNKALGLVWPLDYCVICHVEHLDAPVPPYICFDESRYRWGWLESRDRLFVHGTSCPRGIPIKISHHAPFSTDLGQGASEGGPSTGGSVMLVAMQLAYHLGFRTFLLAGFELQGRKCYETDIYSENALDGQRRLFRSIAPILTDLKVNAFLVEPGEACANDAFAQISMREAEEIAATRMFSCSSCNREISDDDEYSPAFEALSSVRLCRSCLLSRKDASAGTAPESCDRLSTNESQKET